MFFHIFMFKKRRPSQVIITTSRLTDITLQHLDNNYWYELQLITVVIVKLIIGGIIFPYQFEPRHNHTELNNYGLKIYSCILEKILITQIKHAVATRIGAVNLNRQRLKVKK